MDTLRSAAMLPPKSVQNALSDRLPVLLPMMTDLAASGRVDPRDFEVRYCPLSSGIGSPVETRSPVESWMELTYPFSSSQRLRDKYMRLGTDFLRFGKLLEDMDALAGDVAYRHVQGEVKQRSVTIVTAVVDRMDFIARLDTKSDLRLRGYVSWVGRSSMEVRIDVCSLKREEESYETHLGQALFVMAARDITVNQAYRVPALRLSDGMDPLEELKANRRFELGVLHQNRRKQHADSSLWHQPPRPSEIPTIHRLFLEHKHAQDTSNFIPLSSTRVEACRLMHSQDRNAHGKVFGGHLMREAFEIGWVTALLYANPSQSVPTTSAHVAESLSHADTFLPQVLSCDDITFLQPVSIGAIIKFTGRVAYNGHTTANVLVEAEHIQLGSAALPAKTNEFHFAFKCSSTADNRQNAKPLRQIMPVTYEECIIFLDAKRRRDKILEDLGTVGTVAV
eukprot:GILK01006361.1.p1 GENE.GILK01006361.1~~GILK01006361.1.p1  ORF type:complete len:480 (+),score=64.67 GILK01006361.1:89-1441(+)